MPYEPNNDEVIYSHFIVQCWLSDELVRSMRVDKMTISEAMRAAKGSFDAMALIYDSIVISSITK